MDQVIVIPALGDNYIYLYKDEQGNAFVVDPGESKSVLHVLNENQLDLKAILITHNHFDHTGGVDELRRKAGPSGASCEVIGPDSNDGKIIETSLQDVWQVCGVKIQIISTPGHTRSSVCYYVLPSENRPCILFTGDTLFIGGCGRLMGCDARTMWQSLEKIAALPDDTLVYPGHDYTLENYEFATQIAPGHNAIQKRLQEIKEQQGRDGLATVPSTIAQEKATNIFLLARTPEIKTAIDMPGATDAEVFAELRHRKDIYG